LSVVGNESGKRATQRELDREWLRILGMVQDAALGEEGGW